MANHAVILSIVGAVAWVALGCSADAARGASATGGFAGALSISGGGPGAGGSAGNASAPPVAGNAGTPAVTSNGGWPPITGDGGRPPINGNGGTITGNGGTPAAGAGGTASTGGVGGAMGTGGSTVSGGKPPADKLPTVNGACPAMTTGTATVNGTPAHLWVGTKPGPAYIYWHATGQTYNEVMQGMPGATTGVGSAGGFVVSFDSTNSKGTNTGNNVWYTGDIDSADQVLACAIEKGIVDTSRIYTAGYSAGGLQACAMITLRGKYLAAGICYSGGAAIIQGTPMDKSNLPAALLLHGAAGKDVFILDFNMASQTWGTAYVKAGGFAINCDDGGDHLGSAGMRMGFGGRAMKFFQAHTYGVKPEPYSPLPSDWPMYCQIMK